MVKCDGCNRQFKNGRALAAHKRWHCETDKHDCECEDGGDWELLTDDTPGAYDLYGKINPYTGKKYHKYCTVCREVI